MAAAKPMIITKEEGTEIAHAYLNSLNKCFAANDFESQKAMMAPEVEWDWTGDVAGKGPMDEYYKVLAGSWQLVVSQFLPTNVFVVTDTQRGIICITFDIVLIMDGRGKVPINPASTFTGKNMFEIQVDEAKKINRFRGVWDGADEHMMSAFGAVMAAMA
eukprot:g5849.t1